MTWVIAIAAGTLFATGVYLILQKLLSRPGLNPALRTKLLRNR